MQTRPSSIPLPPAANARRATFVGRIGRRLGLGAICLWIGLLGRAAVADAGQPGGGAVPATPASVVTNNLAADVAPSNKVDVVALRFATTCAGCHSLSGAKLTGPELTPATGWPTEQLQIAIKRMEKNVGPMSDVQVAEMATFMQTPDLRERLKAAQDRIQAQFMAKMAPPDAVIGKGLFLGSVPLRNGGLACNACHAAAGAGGNLGPDLTGVFTKLGGQTPLVSAIEKSSFKIMAPHYARHPVTTQEALHLAQFFATLNPAAAVPVRASFLPLGAGSAVALLVGLSLYLRRQRACRGRDTRLQRRRN